MRIDVITLFPDLLQAIARYGITRRALERGMLELVTWNPRDYTVDPHRTVDDRPYGGGPGMVMKVQPLRDALNDARKAAPGTSKIIYLSPQGRRLDQERVRQLAVESGLILIAGRYEGVDQRFVDMEVEQELSIGDYVISGGELAAMVVVDAVTRLLSGALGDPLSASQDSFMNGLFDYPHYTRPENINGCHVPSVLLSGNHAAIRQWRRREALGRTWLKRPELLEQMTLTERDWRLLDEFIEVYHQHS